MEKSRGKGLLRISDNSAELEFFQPFISNPSSPQIFLPRAFIKHFNGSIPNKAILKDRSGKSWHVRVRETESGFCFKNGLQDFVIYHSVAPGDVMIFKYKGKSLFEVKIFSVNGCEKEKAKGVCDIINLEEDSETEITCTRLPPACKRKNLEIGLERNEKSGGGKRRTMDEFFDNGPSFFMIIYGTCTIDQNVVIPNPKIIKEFATDQNLKIPSNFVKHLPKKLPDRASLRGPTGEHWHVKICKNESSIYLQDGWQKFFTDHSLRHQEFLLFKYNGDMCFDVQIFNTSACERVYVSTIRTCGMAESFTSEFPYFKKCMVSYNVERPFKVVIPWSFARKHLRPLPKQKIYLKNPQGKSWEVTYISNKKNKMLSAGWQIFVRDNELKIGDICIFELVAVNEFLVHIF